MPIGVGSPGSEAFTRLNSIYPKKQIQHFFEYALRHIHRIRQSSFHHLFYQNVQRKYISVSIRSVQFRSRAKPRSLAYLSMFKYRLAMFFIVVSLKVYKENNGLCKAKLLFRGLRTSTRPCVILLVHPLTQVFN